MFMDYEFLAPQHIVFGWGRRAEVGTLARSLGRRAFVVIGSRTLQGNGAWSELKRHLQEAGVEPIVCWIGMPREPKLAVG